MIQYNIVSYCRRCHKRMVRKKGEINAWYCPECKAYLEEAQRAETEREAKENAQKE